MKYEDFQHLLFEHKDNGVLLMTLNRPEVMNATNALTLGINKNLGRYSG